LFDFCIRKKASKDFHYEGINIITGEASKYNKLIRYYVSNDGEKIYKLRNDESTSKAAKRSQAEAGEWLCHVCNYLPNASKLDNINYTYYINKAEKLITKITTGGKRIKKSYAAPNQISLF